MLAKLAELCLRHDGEIDFSEIAHREGGIQLRKYLDAGPGFRQHYGATGGDATLSVFVVGVLEITSKVVATEWALTVN